MLAGNQMKIHFVERYTKTISIWWLGSNVYYVYPSLMAFACVCVSGKWLNWKCDAKECIEWMIENIFRRMRCVLVRNACFLLALYQFWYQRGPTVYAVLSVGVLSVLTRSLSHSCTPLSLSFAVYWRDSHYRNHWLHRMQNIAPKDQLSACPKTNTHIHRIYIQWPCTRWKIEWWKNIVGGP